MLALKKKREAQRKAAEEAAKAEAASPAASAPAEKAAEGASAGGQVSLFGIGGQKKTKKGESGTKKTPGEIRIQKGMYSCRILVLLLCLLLPTFEPTRFDSSIAPSLNYYEYNSHNLVIGTLG